MPISRLDRFMVDEKTAEVFDHYQKVRGNAPNMFRTMANRLEIMRTMVAHFRSVMETRTLSQKLKELGVVRTSQINRCEYWLASHTVFARRPGWTDDQIEHLTEFETRSDFDESEKAALRLAEIETRDPLSFDDAHWSDLRKHFDEGQIIELVSAIGLFNYFSRVNDILRDILRMEPTK